MSGMSWGEVFTPVNIALGAAAAFLLHQLFKPRPDTEVKPRPEIKPRDFTLKELMYFDGTRPSKEHGNEKVIYLAVDGVVFDVTDGEAFYGPGGPYGVLAGRDATRALGTMDLTLVQDEWDDCGDLVGDARDTMLEWKQKFSLKYPIRGRLVREHSSQTAAE